MNVRSLPLLRGHYEYPVWHRVNEIIGICLYFLSLGFLVYRLIAFAKISTHVQELQLLIALFCVLGAYVISDFVSGLVHCAADNFGQPTTPLLGPAFIRPFRDHHVDPEGITRHDFIETNGNSCLVNLLATVPMVLWFAPGDSLLLYTLNIFVASFTLFIVFTNQFHKWSHQKQPARWITWLQHLHFILPPEMHKVHHTVPFDRYYCITSGALNSILDRLGFFPWFVRLFSPPATKTKKLM